MREDESGRRSKYTDVHENKSGKKVVHKKGKKEMGEKKKHSRLNSN